MVNLSYEIETLGTRVAFNRVVRYAKTIAEIVDEIESNYQIADVLNDFIAQGRFESNYVSPIMSSLLLDKYNYNARSHNLTQNVADFTYIAEEIARWKAVDIVIIYFHPELGVTIINPKRLESLKAVQNFKKNELVTVYAGSVKGGVSDEVKQLALEKCIALLSLEKIKGPAPLLKGAIVPKERKIQAKPPVKEKPAAQRPKEGKRVAAAPAKAKAQGAPAAAAEKEGQKKMTPFYSIPVTNELFHNGNVEAWKKIIESYQTKYPGTEVYIFYDRERIHDINTLFKWGKVKHGSVILIAAAGNNIKDVAKLQKYLRQGASPMFEAFLKFPVNHVLNLF